MLINLSNHPSSQWDIAQQKAAQVFGKVVDMPFPLIPPDWDSDQVEIYALEYFEKIKTIARSVDQIPVIHITGEQSFCFLLTQLLLRDQFICIMSTTERIVKMEGGTKVSVYRFQRFRKYKLI